MRAVVVTRHGGPEVLEMRDEPSPLASAGQLLVAVEAVGVNYRDIYEREGSSGAAPPFVAGIEGAGAVAAVGEEVTGFSVGDRVAWSGAQGSYAELVVVDAARAVPVPDGVSSELAAAALLQGMTAHYLATTTYPVRPGDDVLVHAAAGGVGLLLTQIVKMRGGRVIGTTSSDEKAKLARRAGAEEVIGYDGFAEQVRALTGGEGVAVAYDGVGKATFDESLASLRPRGLLVLYGSASGAVPPFETMRLENQGSLFLARPSLRHYTAKRDELLERAADVFGWIRDGKLHVQVGARYPLEEAGRAHEDLAGRKSTGKLLLLPHFQRGTRPSSRSSSRPAQEPSRASAARGIGKGSPLDRVSDEQLAHCAARNADCVEAFVARYEEKIRACAWRMVGDPNEIEDLTQETVLRLIRSLPSFRGEASAATWVYRIARNTCVDAHRRRAARPQTAPLELGEEASAAEAPDGVDLDPAALLEDAAAQCFVEHALRELPRDDYGRIASLRLLDGLSNEEIAARLGTSVDSVKSKLKRARAQLREKLAEPRACPLCPPGEFRFGADGLS